MQIKVWSNFTGPGSTHPTTFSDPAAVKLADGQLITVAFVPSGAVVPKPSSQTILALLQARSGTTGGSSSVTVPVTPTTSPATSSSVPTPTTPTTAAGR
jgi:hypothetical protein